MSVEFCVVSIGALSHNPLWGESSPVRTAHATTTYVQDGPRRILVDPSLPAIALAARFNERTGKMLQDVTDVFCTTLRSVHRRSVEAIPSAAWWASELEIQACRHNLETMLESADRLSGDDAAAAREDLKLLERFNPAPDKLTGQVSLFPLPGASAGSTGLLLCPPTTTIVIAGDAALTAGHVLAGQVWKGCTDAQAAIGSLRELVEISDAIVPGHDNLMITPHPQWF